MNFLGYRVTTTRAFLVGMLFGVLLGTATLVAVAATDTILPNGDGGTNNGTQQGTCGDATNASCIDDASSTSTSPTGDFIRQSRDNIDFFQMSTISGVDTVSTIYIPVYHVENATNMRLDVSLWAADEVTQHGTTQTLGLVSGSAAWGTATFSGLSLSSTDLGNLRVRLRCTRVTGGSPATCDTFAMFGSVVYTEAVGIIASTVGTQKDLLIGTTSAHVGASFVISEELDGRDITSITITENGSVDAANHLKNIALYYEMATDCSVAVFNGTGVETQFGSTDANGFSAADGTSVFTDSVAIASTSDMCVYVVLDVQSGATLGQTIEIQIADPTSDIQASPAPVISPGTAVSLAGITNLLAPKLTQVHYHWRNDDGSEAGATSATGGTEDTLFGTVAKATTYRLRIEVSNEGTATSNSTQFRLEYAEKGLSCDSAVTWLQVNGSGDWDMSDTAEITTPPDDTTNIGTTTPGGVTDENNTFVGTNAFDDTNSQLGSITLSSTEFYEMEFAIEVDSGVTDGEAYCFRVTNAGTPLPSYLKYPEAIVSADVNVAGYGTQVSSVTIPTNNVQIGQFVFTDTTAGGHDIDEITITASTSASVADIFDNIKLYYDIDNSGPLDCSGETLDTGSDSQFGATDTDGFSVSGKSTFTESVSPPTVSPSAAVCLYVVLDVTASSTNGDTVDIQIVNPPTEVQMSSGSISPNSTVNVTGITTLTAPFVRQEHFHWRNNLGTEATAGSLSDGTPNTAIVNLARNTPARLRFGVSNTGGESSGAYQYRLEWAQKVTVCEDVDTWINIDTVSDEWATSSSQLVNGDNTTDISNGIGGVTNVGNFLNSNAAQTETTGTTGNITLAASDFVEIEYALQATALAKQGTTYCFRVSNAGTDLDGYAGYAEATIKLATDFKIQRGSANILSGSTTAVITAGDEYDQPSAASSAFIRILNNQYTGRGPVAGATGNNNSSDVTAFISNPGNIMNSITFSRSGTSNDTYIEWEIIEYIGAASGENEMIVRSANTAQYLAANTTFTTGTISGIADDNDVVPFITGQRNPNTGRFDYHAGLSTSAWNSAGDTVTFTRGVANSIATDVSYAVVEFTGANWKVQRAQLTHTSNATTSVGITVLGSITKAFVHSQHRAGANQDRHADFGHRVWLSGVGAVSFDLANNVTTAGNHVSVAWIVENTQSIGDVMVVTEIPNGVVASGGGLTTSNFNIGHTLADITVTGMFFNSTANGTGRTFPEPILSTQLISNTQFRVQVTDDGDANTFRAQIVEWPTAARKLIQDDFQLYVDNDLITPIDPWPAGVDDLGENAPMTADDGPIALGESIRIRMNLQVTAATMPSGIDAFILEYAESPGTCSAVSPGNWHRLGSNSSTTALWRAHAGTPADGTTLPSTILGASTVVATYEEATPTALTPNVALVGDFVEFDWNIEHNGAKDKTDYCFRMVGGDRSELESYSTYPVIRTVGYGPVIGGWRWYNDATSTTPTNDLAGEDVTPIDVEHDNEIKLRLVLAEKSGATGVDTKFALQFSEYADFSVVQTVISTTTCATATTTSNIWCYADGAGNDNQIINSSVISDADSCVAGSGPGCGTRNEGSTAISTFDHTAFTNAEFEFTIRNDGARAGAVYYFRLFDVVNNEAVLASSTFPSLAVLGPQLVFTTEGITAGTNLEGVEADVTTTPTAIPFGAVPLDTEYEAIYRLNVGTNATDGFQLFMYQRQPLTNTYGDTIPPVTGTNASPAAWSGGCLPAATGCFGYHAGDDTLAGGSSRFAPNDSYAALTTTPEEVMFSSVPDDSVAEIVFKLQITIDQPAGDYQNEIVYLAVPTY